MRDVNAARQLLHEQAFRVGLLLDCIDTDRSTELDRFLQQHGELQWVGVIHQGVLDAADCRRLVTDHLCDFHSHPVDQVRLAHTLGHAHGWAMLHDRPRSGADSVPLHAITGNGAAIARLRGQIRKVAAVQAPVLIWGESGSGKELTAQAIHAQSRRAAGPFVPINCGAIPAALIQSELFGHERGAFTGATKDKTGLIESASGGTLFLDEIGDLPRELQSNLLRFLQEGTICRVGGTRSIRADARVIAASHVDLKRAVAEGTFREDLYYRLSVLPISVPALRERLEDLPALAEHIFNQHVLEKGAHVKGLSRQALRAMAGHDWPGNVRELINRIRRAMVLAEGRLITPADLDLASPVIAEPRALAQTRVGAELEAISMTLARTDNNISRAARELGVSRMTLYRLMAKHNISL